MKSPRGGFNLIEICVALAIIGVAALAVSTYLSETIQSTFSMSIRQGRKGDLSVIGGQLQKNMSNGSTRMLAFSGLSAATVPADKEVGRYIIPAPGKCVDFSDCPGFSSLYYISFNKSTAPMATAICMLTSVAGGNYDILVVDAANSTLGPVALVPTGVKVGDATSAVMFPTGIIRAVSDDLLALLNPPQATLWRTTGAAAAINLLFDVPTSTWQLVDFGMQPLPANCLANAIKDGSGKPVSLIGIPIAAFKPVPFFTAGAGPSKADIDSLITTNFPMRVLQANMRAVGAKMDPAPATTATFGLYNCSINVGGFTCNPQDIYNVSGIMGLVIQEIFYLPLSGANPLTVRYSLTNALTPNPQSCVDASPACVEMPYPAYGSVKVLYSAAETSTNLDPAGFSLLKQEQLAHINFVLQFKNMSLGNSEYEKNKISERVLDVPLQ